jgi:hypothetical protein
VALIGNSSGGTPGASVILGVAVIIISEGGAVADKCHSIDNAMKLPKAVFKCSNLPPERD